MQPYELKDERSEAERIEALKVIALREKGRTYNQIAVEVGTPYGCAKSIVYRYAPHLKHVAQNIPGNKERVEKIRKWKQERRTQTEIAELLGLTRERVRQIIDKHLPQYSGKELSLKKCDRCRTIGTPSVTKFITKYVATSDGPKQVDLCVSCWKPFSDYCKTNKCLKIYSPRYEFITYWKENGILMKNMAEEYFTSIKQPLALSARYQPWPYRQVAFYKRALMRKQLLELAHPWLATFYGEVFNLS